MESNQPFEVVGDIGCVGKSVVGDPFSYATIWGDDPLTVEKNGLADGDRFTLFPFPMENDAIYIMRSATVDTTFSALMDSLTTELASLSLAVDNIITSRDSLQVIIDNFPDIADLQNRLNTANGRVAVLESDLAAANLQFGVLVTSIRDMLNKLRS